MAEEEKKDETAESIKEADEAEANSDSSTSKEEEPDYAAIAQAEAERREKAEKAAAEAAFKLRAKKRGEEDSTEVEYEDEDDKPLTKKDLQIFLARTQAQMRAEAQSDKLQTIATSIASSDAEKAAILNVHANRVFPDGMSLAEQLEEAKAIVNSKKMKGTMSEMARALAAKDMVKRDAISAQRDGIEGTPSKLPSNSPLKAYKHEGGSVYSKKLASGKTMYVNANPRPGEKKSWAE